MSKRTRQATQVAQAATYNNPVSIMKLEEVCNFAQQQLDKGLSEAEAINAAAEFIKQLNKHSQCRPRRHRQSRREGEMRPKQLKPITLELRLSYTFDPVDHLPDDWQGTREEAIERFRSDIAENLHNWLNPRDIYGAIREAKPDPTPELLSALMRLTEKVSRANAIQHSCGTIQPEDWAELYQLQNESKAAIAKAEGRAE
jgi:hypothetical protein